MRYSFCPLSNTGTQVDFDCSSSDLLKLDQARALSSRDNDMTKVHPYMADLEDQRHPEESRLAPDIHDSYGVRLGAMSKESRKVLASRVALFFVEHESLV
jgi:hypothetical protein